MSRVSSHRSGYSLERIVQEIEATADRDKQSSSQQTDGNNDLAFRPGIVHLLKNRFTQLSYSENPSVISSIASSRPVSCSASPAITRKTTKSKEFTNRLPASSLSVSSSDLPQLSKSFLRQNGDLSTSERNLPLSSSSSTLWESSKGLAEDDSKLPAFSFSGSQSLRNASSESFLNRVGVFEARCNDINDLPIKNIVASTRSMFENITNCSVSLHRPPVTRKRDFIAKHGGSVPSIPTTLANSFTSSSTIQFTKPSVVSPPVEHSRTVQVIHAQSSPEPSPEVPIRKFRSVNHNNNYIQQHQPVPSVRQSFPPPQPVRRTAPAVVEVKPYTPDVILNESVPLSSPSDFFPYKPPAVITDELPPPRKPKSFIEEGRRAVHKSQPSHGKSWIFTTDRNFKKFGSSVPMLVRSSLDTSSSQGLLLYPANNTMSREMAAQRTFWDSYREDQLPSPLLITLDADLVAEARRLVATRESSEGVDLDSDSFDGSSLEDDDTLEEREDCNLKSSLRNPFRSKLKLQLQFAPSNQLETLHTYPSEASLLSPINHRHHRHHPPLDVWASSDLHDTSISPLDSPPPPSDMEADSLDGSEDEATDFEDSLSAGVARASQATPSATSKYRTLSQGTPHQILPPPPPSWTVTGQQQPLPLLSPATPPLPRTRRPEHQQTRPVVNGNGVGVGNYAGSEHSWSSSMSEEQLDILF